MKNPKHKIQVREALAFHLFADERLSKTPEGETDAVADVKAEWRNEQQIRSSYSAKATCLLDALGNAGVALRVSSSKKLGDFIEELVTIPEQKAYDPYRDLPKEEKV